MLRDLQDDFKIVNHSMFGLLSKDNEKHIELYTQKDSLNNYFLIQQDDDLKKKLPYTLGRDIIIDVVGDEKPVPCKIWIGDRKLPSIKFTIEEVDTSETKKEKAKRYNTTEQSEDIQQKVKEFKLVKAKSLLLDNIRLTLTN